jgi:hypothetical protein
VAGEIGRFCHGDDDRDGSSARPGFPHLVG